MSKRLLNLGKKVTAFSWSWSCNHHTIAEGTDASTSTSTSTYLRNHLALSNRTGNLWTAVAHIITAVIGSGVLSLAWSMAQLGWIAGPLCMLSFASFSFISSILLSNCYRYPDPHYGLATNPSYLEAVHMILGKRSAWACDVFLCINMIKIGVVYTITSGISMRAIRKSNCYHKQGHDSACQYGSTLYMLLFGIVQLLLSQIPNFRKTEWLSIIAATMSFTYSLIGSALGLAKVIGDREIKGGIKGIPTDSVAQKVWLISQALGNIAFAYPYSLILLEIQDTLKSPPSEKVTMMKASIISICLTTFFYLCCGGFGYAAFGNLTPGNLLTGFGFYEPYWLIDFTNACVVLHLVGGYQVFSQPLFAIVERWFAVKFPNSGFVTKNYDFLSFPKTRLNLLRLCFRTCYVALTTSVAIIFPYFNQVVAVAGALTFWPIVIYFPVEMYFVQKKIIVWTRDWVILRIYAVICLLVTLFALVGSLEGLITAKFG